MFERIKQELYKDDIIGMAYLYWSKGKLISNGERYNLQRFMVVGFENKLEFIRYGRCKTYDDYELPMVLSGLEQTGYKSITSWIDLGQQKKNKNENNVIQFQKKIKK